MATVVIAYGVLLAILALVIDRAAPMLNRVSLITGVAGGALAVLWGIVALAGHKRRTWVVLTTVAVALLMLSQVVEAWLPTAAIERPGLPVRLLLTLMFLMTVGMIMYLLHGERPPEFYQTGSTRQKNSSSREDAVHTPGVHRAR